jgi:putative transposase
LTSQQLDDIDSTEIFSCSGGWLYKRKKCNPYSSSISWQKKNYGRMSFWARGYFVSTVGTDEDVVRTYIRGQKKEDNRVEQLRLFK